MRSLLLFCLSLGTLATCLGNRLPAQENPDRIAQPNVQTGKITKGEWNDSQIFPGTKRAYSIYVPAQYNPEQPASLMVFMDGSGYSQNDGAFRAPIVLDNLIHQKRMPVTVAVFVNPGNIPANKPGSADRSNR
ncbi:MAG: hydrolase, partial [Planctomycetota bacterium]